MTTRPITKEEVYALTDMIEQASTDAGLNDLDECESKRLKPVASLLGKLKNAVLK